MKVVYLCCVGTLCMMSSTLAYADLPLTVEDLITDKGKVKLEMSFSYANSNLQGVATAEPITIQTGETSFVTLPALVGDGQKNNDTMVATLGLRYGITGKAEAYTRASFLYTETRTNNLGSLSGDTDSRFADAWVGINYQFKQDNDTPALLGFTEVALREKYTKDSRSLKSWMAGITAYKAIDPIVFSLTAGYRLNQHRQDGNVNLKPGNLLFLNPSVAFAVNDRITLTTGSQWTSRHADRFGGKAQSFRRTSTDLLMGVGYGISKKSTLNFTFKQNASGQDGADLRLTYLHTF